MKKLAKDVTRINWPKKLMTKFKTAEFRAICNKQTARTSVVFEKMSREEAQRLEANSQHFDSKVHHEGISFSISLPPVSIL